MEEIEVKFLEADVPAMEQKLKQLGAVRVADFFYKRGVYDFPDRRLNNVFAWVRVRDEGDRVVLTYKQRLGVGDNHLKDGGMKEIEVIVSDFNETRKLLEAIGLEEKFYEENKRTRYMLGSVEIDIDTWPLIPAYIEIEGNSWEDVEKVSGELGLAWDDHLKCSTMQIYAHYGINENEYAILTFEKQMKKNLSS